MFGGPATATVSLKRMGKQDASLWDYCHKVDRITEISGTSSTVL